jgi:hypothetical protein
LHHQPPRRQTFGQIGCETNAVAMSDRMVSMTSFAFVLVHLLFFKSQSCTDLVLKSATPSDRK